MKRHLAVIAMLANTTPAAAWNGYDWNQGTYIEIGKGEQVRPGREVEVFDYRSGQYRQMEVQEINRRPYGPVEIRVIDSQTGQPHTLEMDRR